MLALGGFSALMELTLVPRRRLATGVAMKAAAGDRLYWPSDAVMTGGSREQ
jgi:hypothetical protein